VARIVGATERSALLVLAGVGARITPG